MFDTLEYTDHAIERWAERFPKDDMKAQIKTAIPFGCQLGKDLLYLCSNDAVAVIRKNTVITFLTKDQALANMQMGIRANWRDFFYEVNPLKPEPVKKKSKEPKKPCFSGAFNDEELLVVKRHAKEYLNNDFSDESVQRRKEDLAKIGITDKSKVYQRQIASFQQKIIMNTL